MSEEMTWTSESIATLFDTKAFALEKLVERLNEEEEKHNNSKPSTAPEDEQTPQQIIKSQTKEEREAYTDVLIRMKMEGVDFIEFDGMNCFDCSEEGEKCRGWDGESRRCDCTNRRVDWEYDSDFDEIRAVAY